MFYLQFFVHPDSNLLNGAAAPVKSISVVGSWVSCENMTHTFRSSFS